MKDIVLHLEILSKARKMKLKEPLETVLFMIKENDISPKKLCGRVQSTPDQVVRKTFGPKLLLRLTKRREDIPSKARFISPDLQKPNINGMMLSNVASKRAIVLEPCFKAAGRGRIVERQWSALVINCSTATLPTQEMRVARFDVH